MNDKVNRITKSLKPYLEDAKKLKTPTLHPTLTLIGHTHTVEDLVFSPRNDHEIVSVGQDRLLIYWDARSGSAPVDKVSTRLDLSNISIQKFIQMTSIVLIGVLLTLT